MLRQGYAPVDEISLHQIEFVHLSTIILIFSVTKDFQLILLISILSLFIYRYLCVPFYDLLTFLIKSKFVTNVESFWLPNQETLFNNLLASKLHKLYFGTYNMGPDWPLYLVVKKRNIACQFSHITLAGEILCALQNVHSIQY